MEQAASLAQKPFLVIRRRYPVAPEKVWRAWTEPQALKRWFGPGGPRPVSVAEVDLRVGGRFRICFGGADGGGTEMEFRHERFVDETVRDGHRRGWTETFGKLEQFLATER